ncbi:Fungal trans [Geosmithia morbida]|uniref:Fungal trans n=1 Tax=Geosmithia morbida TaxID=1094350 RepID=A0A9P5D3X4_9HYPO|nr:Fungal trans [Geosmithia morbida]KAF4125432.1 Fungal trans [Geosmithia morbida]
MSSSGVVRGTALRAGGACVRCRKGKTKCVYETGRPPCRNCAKGMHECYLPSESMAHHHGQSPARHSSAHRSSRDSLPASATTTAAASASNDSRQSGAVGPPAGTSRLTPELLAECERVVSKTFPACVAFHKPSFVQQLKNGTLEPCLVYGLLTCAARSSHNLIRRYGSPSTAAETFAAKAMALINQNLDHPNLADIQSLCLIVIHEWGSRNAVRAYIVLGQAARMLQMFRILNSHRTDPDQFLRDESFRRTLWLIYILDCLLTSTPGRYPCLSVQDSVDTPLPCSDINFAFGNAVYVKTLTQAVDADPHSRHHPVSPPTGEVGEFGYIVIASTIWRDVVGMLTVTTLQNFREEACTDLISKIDGLRVSLPMQFVDKPGQINLHMTMGSGFTFAMLHCLLHCSSIFVHRRRLLQDVTASGFGLDAFRMTPRCHDIVDRLFTSCHAIISLLAAVEAGSEKDHVTCFPIFMLFSAFTAGATVAYLSLKGLTPHTTVETAGHIVGDSLRFMTDGTENWPLMASWLRHLTVMQRVLHNDAAAASTLATVAAPRHNSAPHIPATASSVKDEAVSSTDGNGDVAMDYDHQQQHHHSSAPPPHDLDRVGGGGPPSAPRSVSESPRDDSEPPVTIPRRPGVTTINGNTTAVSEATATPPGTSSPPRQQSVSQGAAPSYAGSYGHPSEAKHSPDVPSVNGQAHGNETSSTSQDMTAPELCAVFERQLLEMDDLAAFMGGGV